MGREEVPEPGMFVVSSLQLYILFYCDESPLVGHNFHDIHCHASASILWHPIVIGSTQSIGSRSPLCLIDSYSQVWALEPFGASPVWGGSDLHRFGMRWFYEWRNSREPQDYADQFPGLC